MEREREKKRERRLIYNCNLLQVEELNQMKKREERVTRTKAAKIIQRQWYKLIIYNVMFLSFIYV